MPLEWLEHRGPRAVARLAAALYPVAEFLGLLTPGRFFRAAWQMRPLTGLLVLALIAAPWYVLVGMRTDGRWLYEFMAKYNLGPFVKPILGHTGPFYYHLLTVFIGFFPWSVFLGPTIVEVVRRLRQRDPCRVGLVLVSCWAVVDYRLLVGCGHEATAPYFAGLSGPGLADGHVRLLVDRRAGPFQPPLDAKRHGHADRRGCGHHGGPAYRRRFRSAGRGLHRFGRPDAGRGRGRFVFTSTAAAARCKP